MIAVLAFLAAVVPSSVWLARFCEERLARYEAKLHIA